MSIATEYTRLKNAKEDIKAYITGKGVTVPDGTKLDGMTALLEQISGSELLAEFSQMNPIVKSYMESVTYDPSDYTVSHILSYSYAETGYTKWFPAGYDVNLNANGELHLADEISVVKKASSAGVNTLLNAIPNKVAHWWNTVNGNVKQNGTIKPTGQVRMINTTASNVRDLGGWACDGGTIKYGKIFRGGLLAESDAEVLVKQLRIKHDIDLRSETDNGGITASPLGNEVVYTTTPAYVWYSINSNASDWYIILKAIFDAVKKNEPVIFHCAAGADRTGTVACIIEAILGVSQSDIDKDFEITSFAVHPNARRRTDDNWKNLISEINAFSVGDTFRDRVINFVGTLGFTSDEINAFRAAMIDGTPETITVEEPPTARIPSEYQEVAWVQIGKIEGGHIHSGVHTAIKWSEANKIIVKVQNITSTNANDIYFSGWSSETAKQIPYIATRTSKANYLFGAQSGLTNYAVSPNTVDPADLNANEFTLTFNSTSTADIFFGGWHDGAFSHPHKWCIVQFYNGDTLLADYVPCYRKSDAVIGFYDLLGGAFYTDASGSNGFLKGENV